MAGDVPIRPWDDLELDQIKAKIMSGMGIPKDYLHGPNSIYEDGGRYFFGSTELDAERPETWGNTILGRLAEMKLTDV